jgi:hypothetical protein
LGVFTYWVNGYYGGAVASIGGALIFGALPRIRRRRRWRDGLLLGVGLALLANSRPFEGFVLGCLVGVVLLLWARRSSGSGRDGSFRLNHPRFIVPVCVVLAITAASMSLYFYRITGSPFRMPYQLYQQAYDPVPNFIWQPLVTGITYRHAAMQDFMTWTLPIYKRNRTVRGVGLHLLEIAAYVWLFFIGPALSLLLVTAPLVIRDRRIRLLLVIGGVFLLTLLMETYFSLHYAAPLTALIYLVLVQSMRHLYVWKWRGRATGRQLVRALPLICLVMFAVRVGARPLQLNLDPNSWRSAGYYANAFAPKRARIVRQLEAMEGKHLVVVRYDAEHRSGEEWVYNRADIDAAKIVWAREMDESSNRELIGYFRGRRVWLLEADAVGAPRLSPYPSEASEGVGGGERP